ncbi:MAG TPA: hypothetical protein DCE11_04170 [Ruminiclostridium sp.]|jgi:hypothetical protein|nr:hypothetical protein [Ruminiclostridium sp.]
MYLLSCIPLNPQITEVTGWQFRQINKLMRALLRSGITGRGIKSDPLPDFGYMAGTSDEKLLPGFIVHGLINDIRITKIYNRGLNWCCIFRTHIKCGKIYIQVNTGFCGISAQGLF